MYKVTVTQFGVAIEFEPWFIYLIAAFVFLGCINYIFQIAVKIWVVYIEKKVVKKVRSQADQLSEQHKKGEDK